MILIYLLIIASILFYLHAWKRFQYWKRKGVHHESPLPLFGNFPKVLLCQESMGQALKRMYDGLDDDVPYFGVYIFHTPNLVLKSKDLIKEVMIGSFSSFLNRTQYSNDNVDPLAARNLFTLKNDVWRNLRNKLTPAFTSGKLKMMLPLMKEVCGQLEEVLEESSGREVDVRDISRRYAIDIISSCAFGINSASLQNPKSEIKRNACQMLDQSGIKRSFAVFAWLFCPLLVKIFRIPFSDPESSKFLVNLFKESLRNRQKAGIKRNDFVDLLEELRMSEDANVGQNDLKLDDLTMSAQALTFFNAGTDSTAILLTLCLYELALNVDVQKKLREEIISNSNYNYQTLLEMEYLDFVIKEASRKYPFVQFLTRQTEKDYLCPNTNLVIEKGTPVLIPLLAIHYDPKYYNEPEKFNPDRFRLNTRYSYLSFGEGPRRCIGDRFALLSLKLAIVTIIGKYEVSPTKKTEIPMKFNNAAFFLTPKNNEVIIKVTKIR